MGADKVRLGGMALANGVLVHGPTAWACAIRTDDGELKVAARRKRFAPNSIESPLLRGPVRLARCDGDSPGGQARPARGALPVRAAARCWRRCSARRRSLQDRARARGSVGPARRSSSVACSRSRRPRSRCAAATSPPTTAPSTSRSARYEQGKRGDEGARPLRRPSRRPAARSRPRSATRSPPARRASRARPRGSALSSSALAASTEIFGWMVRHPEQPLCTRAREARPRASAPDRDGGADRRRSSRSPRPRSPRASSSKQA